MSRVSPRQERSREMRERILVAAGDLFAGDGIEATSTNHIARHAGISIGSLYRYFSDKDEIVAIIRGRLLAELEARFTEAALGGVGLDLVEGVRAGLAEIVAALAEHRGLVRALAGGGDAGAGIGDIERRLVLLTRSWLLHRLGPLDDEILAAKAWLMVTVGIATSVRIGIDPPEGVDRDALVDETAAMLAAWLAAPPATPV